MNILLGILSHRSLVLASLGYFATACANADELVFAFRVLPPYMVKLENGQYSGSHVEIMQKLSQAVGASLVIKECPLARCIRMLQDGSADVAMGLAPTPERAPYMAFLSPPYAHGTPTYFFQRADDTRTIRSFDDLRPLRIGVINGVRYFDEFDNDKTLLKDLATDNHQNFAKLLAKRIDVIPLGANAGAATEALPEFTGKLKRAEYVRPNPVERYIVLSRKSGWMERRNQLESRLAQLVNTGVISQIMNRYETATPAGCKSATQC
ncbi:substrate-binding periplasmic protein [Parachitinimonas caeni]|uniref:Transporter substrate-binding domain-containing protein n=1 Tax=Parachitinimonas caeni TaxID=3031301 RepID=A0ABT7DWW8_9NEIS|nr:transporter substrate-binding domain-containing protein [Parachitinimonas caeni]MDK2124558.1 transporter substrate-binding domain-containing protein [Parachitinimonas caeni]